MTTKWYDELPSNETSSTVQNEDSEEKIVDNSAASTPQLSEAQLEFENEKKKILQSLPEDYTSWFKVVGFAKWKSKYLPAMVVSPYDVAPGRVRDQWMAMYNKVRPRARYHSFLNSTDLSSSPRRVDAKASHS